MSVTCEQSFPQALEAIQRTSKKWNIRMESGVAATRAGGVQERLEVLKVHELRIVSGLALLKRIPPVFSG
jgi:hypothetical protein